MAEPIDSGQKDFHEWMVTKALAAHLGNKGEEHPTRMRWFFELAANTPKGTFTLAELCGFAWNPEEIDGGAEKSFKNSDRGNLSTDDFKEYLTIAPDFRYWTKSRDRQLIVEAKGTPKPIGQRDRIQAERYFAYLRDCTSGGAVIYFTPNPSAWLAWLINIPNRSGLPFGVVDLKTQIVPRLAYELVHVVGEALVQTADLLKEALRYSKNPG
jgi:hypothetical protein